MASEIEEVLKRITAHQGIQTVVIINSDGSACLPDPLRGGGAQPASVCPSLTVPPPNLVCLPTVPIRTIPANMEPKDATLYPGVSCDTRP